VLDDYTMPSWCFLDDADPDWDDLCRQWNDSDYTQLDMNVTWDISDNLSMVSTTGPELRARCSRPVWSSGVQVESTPCRSSSSISAADSKVDFVTGFNYFGKDSSSPREPHNAVGSASSLCRS
jgi:hypothetical protein